MLGSALYYPHIDIHDPMWLRSAILFWDDIQTIVPSAIESPYQSNDTRICQAEGYLKPLRCDLHSQVIDDLGHNIVNSLDWRQREFWHDAVAKNEAFQGLERPSRYTDEFDIVFHEAGIHPEKMSPELRGLAVRVGLARMHSGRLSPTVRRVFREIHRFRMHPDKLQILLRDLLKEEGILNEGSEDWLMVDGDFATAYMSALASRLSKQVDISPLTSYEPAQASSFRFMFNDVVDETPNNATGTMLAVIMRGIKIDPSINVDRIIEFRRNRADQYADFAGELLELKNEIENSSEGDGTRALERAKELYNTRIERSIRALKRELDDQFIGTLWGGVSRALTISVVPTGALAVFTNLGTPLLLGAGAALAAADIGVHSYLAGRKVRGGNPYTYLHDVNSSFGLPDFGD